MLSFLNSAPRPIYYSSPVYRDADSLYRPYLSYPSLVADPEVRYRRALSEYFTAEEEYNAVLRAREEARIHAHAEDLRQEGARLLRAQIARARQEQRRGSSNRLWRNSCPGRRRCQKVPMTTSRSESATSSHDPFPTLPFLVCVLTNRRRRNLWCRHAIVRQGRLSSKRCVISRAFCSPTMLIRMSRVSRTMAMRQRRMSIHTVTSLNPTSALRLIWSPFFVAVCRR
ncbi:hypothetical protein BC827DRAFT_880529 [Russula dissimulans]|nr:hypothetical protein BC827DRAFT_880529 [Russula dissimulans]